MISRRGIAGVASSLLLAFMGWLSLVHGPSRRVFLPERRCAAAASGDEVLALWREAGVRGRVAVLFTRRLHGETGANGPPGLKYMEEAMQRGVVRTAIHVVPDAAWSEVASNLSRRSKVRPVPLGFVLPFGAGRVAVLPASRLPEVEERALVVVAPGDWSAEDRAAMMGQLAKGKVAADLLVLLRGTPEELTALCDATARR